MTEIDITGIGVFAERCPAASSLTAVLAGGSPERPSALAKPTIDLRPDLDGIETEDRHYLGDGAKAVRNAIADAWRPGWPTGPDDNDDLGLFVACDTAELTVDAVRKLLEACPEVEQAVRRLGEVKRQVSALETFRILSTNAVYHASKQLGARGGAYPVQAMSLSGLCALEDAMGALQTGLVPGRAVVAAYGNMRSIEAMTTFTKLGLVRESGPSPIDPSFAAVAMLLQRRGTDGGQPLAELLAARTFYSPEPLVPPRAWLTMLADARGRLGTPDHVVTYDNGGRHNGRNERAALWEVFPGVSTRNYKGLLGYTGKANSLLDLAAALSDPTIPPGAVVLVCGAGLTSGVGYLAVRKAAPPA